MTTTKRRLPGRNGKLADHEEGPSVLNLLPLHPNSLMTANGHAPASGAPPDEAAPRLSRLLDSSAVTIRLVTLDELRCFHNGAETDLPSQKRRFALLVYLAMERSAPREKIAALFYPEIDEERARNRLKQSTYALRRDFGDDCIETKADELRANAALILDARDFGSLAEIGDYGRALELYRRPFLDGFYLDDADEWERWVDRKRSVLAGTYARAARAWVNTLIEKQEYEAAIAHTTRWLEFDESSAEAHRLHMTALASAGQHAEALAHYETWERRLREEEGTEPSAAVAQLAREIRSASAAVSSASSSSRAHAEFADRTVAVPVPYPEPSPSPRRLPATIALVTTLGLIGTLVWASPFSPSSLAELFYSDRGLDTTRYTVFPFAYEASAKERLNETQVMYEVLSYWRGIGLADQIQVGEALARRGDKPLRWKEARAIARELGAGRFFLGQVSGIGDQTSVHVALYSANRGGGELRSASRRTRNAADNDTMFASLTDELLFGRDTIFPRAGVRGTRSAPAQIAFSHGLNAVQDWRLAAADSAFLTAFSHDAGFAQAALWLALVRSWTRNDLSQWAFAAERAAAGTDQLSTRDRTLVEALRATTRGNADIACGLYGRLTQLDEFDFVPWYSYAHCLATDRMIVPASSSPSGFAFRSGYHTSVDAFVRAFTRLPSAHRGLSSDLFFRLRTTMMTSSRSLRVGRDAGGVLAYGALPSWSGDSLSLIPYPLEAFSRGDSETLPATMQRALYEERHLFLRIARGWAAFYPKSSQALLALAVGLDLTGDAAAVDTMESALRVATAADDKELLRAVTIIMGVKHGFPDNLLLLRRTVARADSLLRESPPGRERHSELMAAVAALRGQVHRSAEYNQNSVQSSPPIPTQVQTTGARLVIYAAFGMFRDSLATLTATLRSQIAITQPEAARIAAHETWLVRSAVLAFAQFGPDTIPSGIESKYYLRGAQLAFTHGDTIAAVAQLDSVAIKRRGTGPITADVLLAEAALLLAAGDTTKAELLLDEGLTNPRDIPLEDLQDPVKAAALGRAILLRANLAAARGATATARRLADCLLVMWSNGTALDSHQRRLLRTWRDTSSKQP